MVRVKESVGSDNNAASRLRFINMIKESPEWKQFEDECNTISDAEMVELCKLHSLTYKARGIEELKK